MSESRRIRITRQLFVLIPRGFNLAYRWLPTPLRRAAKRCVVVFQRRFTAREIARYRDSGETLGGPLARAPVLLLTTRGQRSGASRTTPVAYVADGEDFLVVGAYGGLPWNPDWFHNLGACPEGKVEVDGHSIEVQAEEITGDERKRLWPRMLARIATLEKSQQLADPRRIPLIRLSRTGPARAPGS